MSAFRYKGPSRSPDFLVGLRLRRSPGGLRQGPDHRAARQIDLEAVVRKPVGAAQQKVGRAFKACRIGGPAAQRRFRLLVPPWLVPAPAEREPCVLDAVAVEFKGGGHRNQRESIGQAVSNLEV